MQKLIVVMMCLIPVLGVSAEKLIYTGTVFDKEGKNKKFTYERYQDVQGDKVLDRAVFKNREGEVQTEEKVETLNGELVRYDIDQKQLKQKAWIVVNGDKAEFNLKKFRKRNYPVTHKKGKNFVSGIQIVPLVQKNWDKFLKGEDTEIRLGVWYRQEPIRFNLSQEKLTDDKMTIKMSPSSMFIRAVVDPLYFHFDRKTKDLTSYVGRVVPKTKCGRDYCDYDGLVKYQRVGARPKVEKNMKSKTKNK